MTIGFNHSYSNFLHSNVNHVDRGINIVKHMAVEKGGRAAMEEVILTQTFT